eukprot:GFUD01007826.1.p1 GENE.GFUD01007826.1~~GFUD01007826.1.p1  ORF type:complete len:445 (-),score=151.04 GFUD01007826.1:63-1397(-)
MTKTRVGVVVLGDLGRSPRMQYHVLSLLSHGYMVDLIGYKGTTLPDSITSSELVRVRNIRPVPDCVARLPRLLAYVVKSLWQILFLLLSLPLFSHLSYILVQTPPGIPTLPTLWLYCTFKGTQLVVDWHNYSHTILSLALPPSHPMVTITRILERMFGQLASNAFCVTKAMSNDLASNWGVDARVLYDRPPEKFRPVTLQEKEDLFMKLSSDYPVFCDVSKSTGVIVSSTSWTEDEDFGVLLDALVKYEEAILKDEIEIKLSNLLVVITGKGPQKQYYLDMIEKLGLKHVQFVTPWLESEDYPTMLASADLGVCLHTSSSGLDLPMKVVDMFGCGLPVAAIQFEALSELVKDGENGRIFKDSEELFKIIRDWFEDFPSSKEDHELFRENLKEFRSFGWNENWNSVALNVFKQKKDSDSLISGLMMMAFFVCLFLSFSSFVPVVQ